MAFVGEIYLGGFEPKISDDVCSSAVAFNLKTPSSINEIYTKNNWQIELKAGRQSIIARTPNILPHNDIIRIGFILCEELLDLISIRLRGNLLLDKPGDNNILLFKNNGDYIIQHRDFLDYSIGIESSCHSIDKNGNIISLTNEMKPAWHHAFRYYRFSQTSSHLFEAYRYLWLAFEALLQSICPKKDGKENGETTKEWIKRALNGVGLSGNIDQYVKIRNKLSHSKAKGDISFYNDLNPEVVSDAYKGLIRIWRQIVLNLFKFKLSGGIIPNDGLNSIISILRDNLKLYLSDDSTPPSNDAAQVSPLNLNIIRFSKIEFIDSHINGQVYCLGLMDYLELKNIEKIYRICSTRNDTLFAISFIKDGLIPTGIDRFETSMNIRVLNKRQPKVTF